ncbi:hypothetical protein [Vagococcus bubulae]|uniref:Uncharacterized protein n=1 Tax=Vagococcus bubulae TaxID=1977868 RepID=A0A429ZKC5_9ENTE|nr:hypothetical protein [Vagococcus bubulae]RST94119.1 hypothetical protein CBF36_06995 [Vagococcus bubulae]
MIKKQPSTKSTKENHVKKFTRFISRSSQRFISSFLDDESEKEKHLTLIHQQINKAILQKSLVVLQYQEPSQANYETLVGRIYQHAINRNALVIKLQKSNEIRMISANYIKKISIIHSNHSQNLSISK